MAGKHHKGIMCRRPCRYGPLELNLLSSSGIYVSSSWKLAHGAQRLRGYNTIVRACTGSNAVLWGYCNVSKSITDSVKYPDGKFDNLDVPVRQRLREAFYAADRTKYAGECLLKLVNSFDEEVYMGGPITECISAFTH
jgi:hypothetical protein